MAVLARDGVVLFSSLLRKLPVKRREFITLLGGAAAAWPLAARGQQRAPAVVGLLSSVPFETRPEQVAAFHRGLQEAGYVEGHNVGIEYRSADNRLEGNS